MSDEEILTLRFCDLPIRLQGSAVSQRVKRLYAELREKGLNFKPHVWLSDEWFAPDGIPGIAIPFYLVHPRLIRLEQKQMLEVEGEKERECMKILRHEAGHAIDTAYRMHFRREWQELFGSYAKKYPRYIVIGARLLGRDNAPGGRRFGNDVADWFVSWTAGQAIVDSQSGQRYYPREVLELAKNLPHSGFVFESEILIEAAEHGIRTVSVAIESRYQDGRRASHFRPFADVMRITRMISWRLATGGFRPGNYLRARREPPIVVE